MTIFFGKFVALWKIIAVLTLMLSIAATEMKGQTTCPPEPDCFNDVFQPGTPFTVPLFSSGFCLVEVEWCWRIACGVYTDVVITGLKFDLNQCPHAMDINMTHVKNQIMDYIVEFRPDMEVTIPPCDEGGQVIWRLGLGSCLRGFTVNSVNGPYFYVVPCGSGQCWTTYNYCWDENGQLRRQIQGPFNINDNCPPGTLTAHSGKEQFEMMIDNEYQCVYFCE